MQNPRGRGRGRGSFGGPRGGTRGGFRGAPRGGGRGTGRPTPYSQRESGRSVNPTKLHISNIPEGTTPKELEELFEQCGKVLECDIIRDFAFVHYKSPEEADAAVQTLHGYELNGTAINVRHSTSTLRQKPGANKGDCFRCGGRGHSSLECPTELRERGLLPPLTVDGYPSRPPYDPYDPYPLPPRSAYLDPYERLERDPYYRRRLAAAAAAAEYDPYLQEPLRDPYAVRDPYARGYGRAERGGLDSSATERDPYSRPPPEFYQRRGGRGRPSTVGAGASATGATGGSSYAQNGGSTRPADDPYFYNDDYDKVAQPGKPNLQNAMSRLQNVLETGLLGNLPL